jgi:hypothetical protein
MKYLIAIDDTDNLQSRGTGYLARKLASWIGEKGWGRILGVTRHQLFVHDDIPYTSHNSAACIELEAGHPEEIIYFCRNFVRSECAEGSDAGLCIAEAEAVGEELVQWGQRAKKQVLQKEDAYQLAGSSGVLLEGLSGSKGGVIGALAAVGLQTTGNDGRYLWVKGMRKYMGVMSLNEIYTETGVEEIRQAHTPLDPGNERCLLPEWWRPVLKDKKKVLLVEPAENELYEYKFISKDLLRNISS